MASIVDPGLLGYLERSHELVALSTRLEDLSVRVTLLWTPINFLMKYIFVVDIVQSGLSQLAAGHFIMLKNKWKRGTSETF